MMHGEWNLDTLTEAGHAAGIRIERSLVRRIFLAERVRWRRTCSWATSPDQESAPKRTRIVALHTCPPDGPTVLDAGRLGPVIPRTFDPAPGWSPDGHRIEAPSSEAPLPASLGVPTLTIGAVGKNGAVGKSPEPALAT